jgi:hypothetical protein
MQSDCEVGLKEEAEEGLEKEEEEEEEEECDDAECEGGGRTRIATVTRDVCAGVWCRL